MSDEPETDDFNPDEVVPIEDVNAEGVLPVEDVPVTELALLRFRCGLTVAGINLVIDEEERKRMGRLDYPWGEAMKQEMRLAAATPSDLKGAREAIVEVARKARGGDGRA